ncbi:IS1182 family transposase [Paracoccus albus]|uniref:IS1182 family transposase n=1 Tax=Paracoccus albus TaxID=3017784 RepID=UPI0022F08F3B|nr:IS1182 family transposase [Paracoccus albus]WBU62259.1 IS1182 family transposase [Paracoccus albus]
MLGRQKVHARLFYEFDLETHIPADHLLRGIDRFLDLDGLHDDMRGFYSHTGRPSIDPELMIRMLVVGYVMGLRSERRLCQEVHLNLAYRWFCRLGLEDKVPDHSTFSKLRHGKFRDSDIFRRVFERVVAQCISLGLVGGTGFAVDASLISADVQTQSSSCQDKWDAGSIDPSEAPRAVREYLDTLDEEAFGAATPVKPKFTAHADPASQWTAARKGPAFFAYSDNYLIDTDHGIIMDVEATRSVRQAEVGSTLTMLDRTAQRFSLRPDWLVADTAYGSEESLVEIALKRQILPFIPVIDKGERTDGTLSRSDFTWDDENDRYICPEGKDLRHTRRNYSDPERVSSEMKPRRYRAKKADCQACPLKAKCCPNSDTRSLQRGKYEMVRDFARSCTASAFNENAQKRRKKVEMLFAHLKRILGLNRLRLRGPLGVKDEFTLAATAQNLRKLAKLCPTTAPSAPVG